MIMRVLSVNPQNLKVGLRTDCSPKEIVSKGTVVNRALSSLFGWSLEITLAVPLIQNELNIPILKEKHN